MSKSSVDVRPRVQLFCNDDPVVQQHFRDECNVNILMAKHGASRILEHYGQFQGNYGDFTNVQDYQTSLNQVIAAQDMFMSLPSDMRNRFGNDPSQFLSFVSDESNRDEMRRLGLLKDVVEAPVLVPVETPNLDKTDPV